MKFVTVNPVLYSKYTLFSVVLSQTTLPSHNAKYNIYDHRTTTIHEAFLSQNFNVIKLCAIVSNPGGSYFYVDKLENVVRSLFDTH